ncbi:MULTISPECIES: amidohydrolase family protein [unclassified Curtobacterium]|uniref:amidohydrolase family protein n=1 Tax=unclassified Curtobacterium TaxID=257496 RepID=UPI00226B560B|nr:MULTISPECIES: amidohydrolase family protein [unclassified Curtobacterium]
MIKSFVVHDVRVFTDGSLSSPRDVFVSDGRIVPTAPTEAARIDGAGGTLLPGLIDTHAHVDSRQHLLAYGRWGVTTVLDMGTASWSETSRLRNLPGVASLRSAGAIACAPKGIAVRKMGYPPGSAVHGPADAARFVADRIADGVDHIKIVLEESLPFQPKPLDEATVTALVHAAHGAGLLVCVHATSVKSFQLAARAGADVLTHAPLAGTLSQEQAQDLARRGTATSPTLVMMKKLVEHFPAPIKPSKIQYANPVQLVTMLQSVGATILVGTDANSDPTAPNTIEHGASLHEELALLADAGLAPAAALQAATGTAADVFRLTDRGRISPGLRADLLLVDGDPTSDILATQEIRRVWIAGEEVR